MQIFTTQVLQFLELLNSYHFFRAYQRISFPNYLYWDLINGCFNENYDDAKSNLFESNYWSDEYINSPNMYNIRTVYKDLINHKYNLESLFSNSEIKKIGIKAIINNFGFRDDGSINYGNTITVYSKK